MQTFWPNMGQSVDAGLQSGCPTTVAGLQVAAALLLLLPVPQATAYAVPATTPIDTTTRTNRESASELLDMSFVSLPATVVLPPGWHPSGLVAAWAFVGLGPGPRSRRRKPS